MGHFPWKSPRISDEFPEAMGFEKNEALRALKGGTMEQAVEVRGEASDIPGLVNIEKTMERSTIFNGKTMENHHF